MDNKLIDYYKKGCTPGVNPLASGINTISFVPAKQEGLVTCPPIQHVTSAFYVDNNTHTLTFPRVVPGKAIIVTGIAVSLAVNATDTGTYLAVTGQVNSDNWVPGSSMYLTNVGVSTGTPCVSNLFTPMFVLLRENTGINYQFFGGTFRNSTGFIVYYIEVDV